VRKILLQAVREVNRKSGWQRRKWRLWPFGDGDGDWFRVGLTDGGLERLAPGLKSLGAFSLQVMDVEKDIVAAATRTGVIKKADTFEAQPLAIRLHVLGLFLNEVLGGKLALAVAACSVHGWSFSGCVPLGPDFSYI
jgi:hypothetical protein